MEIKTNKDITDYEANVFMGLSMRQTVLGIAGVIVIAVAYFLTYNRMNENLASWLAIGLGLPCFLFGFVKPHGLKLEKFIAVWFSCCFLSHPYRKFIAENKFYDLCFVTEKEGKRRGRKNVDQKKE